MDGETRYNELLTAVTLALFGSDLNPGSAARIAEKTCTYEPELISLEGKAGQLSILKLYNGPTGTFLDFSINYLASLLEELLPPDGSAVVVSAVRGTGISVAKAFLGRRGITAVLLYPKSFPITGLDESAFINRGGNIIPIQVEGSADDCQDLVNALIRDRVFSTRYNITSANAINPGRLLSQVFYYLYGFILQKKDLAGELIFSIPTGNLGSLIAGLYAWKFGMPVNGFIAAMNSNNAAGNFINSGTFRPQPLIATASPVLDIARPSNLERLESFFDEAPVVMKNMVFPVSVDDRTTLETIKNVRQKYGIFLDPQSAVAFAAAERTEGKDFDGRLVVFATEHPALFAETVYRACGEHIEIPERFKAFGKKTEPIAGIKPDLESFEHVIASCF
jgi:threonine synthase